MKTYISPATEVLRYVTEEFIALSTVDPDKEVEGGFTRHRSAWTSTAWTVNSWADDNKYEDED